MKKLMTKSSLSAILLATSGLVAMPSYAQDVCEQPYTVVPEGCELDNSGTLVRKTPGKNTEDGGPVRKNSEGFSISIDGQTLDADPVFVDRVRKTDLALEEANIQVKFDGLGAEPRLDMELIGGKGPFRSGERVTFQSRMNYPAYVKRGEVRIIDMGAPVAQQTVGVYPINANGQVAVVLPEGRNLVAVHRVYDARGRYDETKAIRLSRQDARRLNERLEKGTDNTARRRIPVNGGAVTVYSDNVKASSTVRTLGETINPSSDGKFVIQRILPAGQHDISVDVSGPQQHNSITRQILIPRYDLFYVGVADLTFGRRDTDIPGREKTYDRGRLAFYLKGKTQSGFQITASADTGEEELSDLFRKLDEKDPRSVLRRIDPRDAYPTYGDDSKIVDDTPTSGKFYLKVEKDGNHLLWGDFKGRLDGNAFIRNERSLYGAQGVFESEKQTANGDAVFAVQAYASQPETLPGREVFQGTGGSVYFLQQQDITIASETLSVQLRDQESSRVLETRLLVADVDYTINYIQGTIVLKRPLSSTFDTGLISGNSTTRVDLVAQYEFTPTAGNLDGFSYGGRAQVWATDKLRFGASATTEKTGASDQKSFGVDALYRFSEKTFVSLDYAETSGPGFGSSFSTDGGLLVNNTAAVGGDGKAARAEVRADFADLGLSADGYFAAYYEKRSQGFSTLDYQVTAATGTEDLWGFYTEVQSSPALKWSVAYDDYSNAVGNYDREAEVAVRYTPSDRLSYEFAVSHLDRQTVTTTGDRTDVAARVTYTQSDILSYYAFGQATVSESGLGKNNRLGAGATYKFAQNWEATGEISGGTRGVGGKLLFNYEKEGNSSAYFGYELDPNRALDLGDGTENDGGRYVVGGSRQVTDTVLVFAENTYDLFGPKRALTSVYGVGISPSEYLTYNVQAEVGRINDATNGDFDRTALSVGATYEDDTLAANGRVELRRERGTAAGTARDADTVLVSLEGLYKLDETQRFIFSLEAAHTDSDQSSVLNGSVVDLSLGYALRPITNDKLNVLFKYRYLRDMFGQVVDGTAGTGPRQESHVLSLDGSYDLNEYWTLGGKIGVRKSRSSVNASNTFTSNDAYLGVVNARYHLVHNWDVLVEGRKLKAQQAGASQYGVLGAVYRHIGNNAKLGLGYNFGKFSDDLTDLVYDDKGAFLNLIAKF